MNGVEGTVVGHVAEGIDSCREVLNLKREGVTVKLFQSITSA